MQSTRFLYMSVLLASVSTLAQDENQLFSYSIPPSDNFDLSAWALNVPIDFDGDGDSDRVNEQKLIDGFLNTEYFFTAPDGGMTFKTYVSGPITSKKTKYTRVNLREMLRRGGTEIAIRNRNGTPTKNTWVLSTAPEHAKLAAGGIDGELHAKLAINHVTTTGHPAKVGKMIFAELRAHKNEPITLFYRKLPGNSHGSIYAVHEESNGNDHLYEIIGSSSSYTKNPDNGIALNQKFSCQVIVKGNDMKITIADGPSILGEVKIDIKYSGYAVANDSMYFTAGVVNKNNTGDANDYVQATYYALETEHSSL